jgi:hypothetical protein
LAVLENIPYTIDTILFDQCPGKQQSKVAAFYSISSTQKGLSGVDLGNFLIKRVLSEISALEPTVTTFITLSPIPAFRQWLEDLLDKEESEQVNQSEFKSNILLKEELDLLNKFCHFREKPAQIFKKLLKEPYREDVQHLTKPILLRLCSRYLLIEKKNHYALDPVANFHIKNGAAIQQLNWFADKSSKS